MALEASSVAFGVGRFPFLLETANTTPYTLKKWFICMTQPYHTANLPDFL